MQLERIPPMILLALGLTAAAGCKRGHFAPPCLNAPPVEYVPPPEDERSDEDEPSGDEGEAPDAGDDETARREAVERLAEALPPDVLARLRD